MSLLTDIRTDTNLIVEEWADPITVYRLTVCGVSTGGEQVELWYTNVVTNADIQGIPVERVARIEPGGLGARAEIDVVWKHGTDVLEGDRFRAHDFLYYINALTRDEDKIITRCSQRTRDDVSVT